MRTLSTSPEHGRSAEWVSIVDTAGQVTERSIDDVRAFMEQFYLHLPGALRYWQSENGEVDVSNSEILSRHFYELSSQARFCWQYNKAMGKPILKEQQKQDSQLLINNFAKLPVGTRLQVYARHDRELPVTKSDGTSEALTWRGRPEGLTWYHADAPDKYCEYEVGRNHTSVWFTDEAEPVIEDADKRVVLTFTEISTDRNVGDEPNYSFALLLPSQYEMTYRLPPKLT